MGPRLGGLGRGPGLGAWAGGPGPGPGGLGLGQGWGAWARGVRTDGWTKYPLHSTEHRPFGAAAQKGRAAGGGGRKGGAGRGQRQAVMI